MWSFTQNGYNSAVQKRANVADDSLTVRGRDMESLRRFCKLAGVPVDRVFSDWPSDYPYRLVVSKDEMKTWACAEIDAITYDNFKNQATKTRGKVYHNMLSSIWSTTHRLTPAKIQKEMKDAWGVYDASWRKSLRSKAGTIISSHWGDDDEPLAPEEEEKLVSMHDLTTEEWEELMKDAP